MKYHKILPALAIALTLALLLAILPAAPTLAVGTLFLSPNHGKIGDSIEAYGRDFNIGQHNFYFARQGASVGDRIGTEVAKYQYLGLKSVGALEGVVGAFVGFFFTVSGELRDGAAVERVRGGTYYVYATFTTDKVIQAKATFTVETVAGITLSPGEATVGAEVKVTGSGFAASQSVTIKFDNTQLKTTTTDANGDFSSIAFTVPESYRGNHTLEAKDASNNSATTTFATRQSITVTPASGAVGDIITISGTGFGATSSVAISFDSIEVAAAATNSVGSFSGVTFAVLAKGAGSYDVKATDESANSASIGFSLAAAAVSLNLATGNSGSEVTVSGSGFRASQSITITFDRTTIATIASDNTGSFTTSFKVPVLTAGAYKVKASDGTNTAEANFTIATGASINPATSAVSPGYVGIQLTINGVGFTVGSIATITYDGNQVATATVNTDGTFSATFKAPASSGGGHSVIATDGVNTKQFAFIMESTPPPTPVPLQPEMDIKAEAEAYFDWEDVTDPSAVTYTLQIATDEDFSSDSIVLQKKGLTQSKYTVANKEKLKSVSQKAPYYWHVAAVDGASNESQWSGTGSFYVGFSWALSQSMIYLLFGIGTLLLTIFGFWLGRKTAYY